MRCGETSLNTTSVAPAIRADRPQQMPIGAAADDEGALAERHAGFHRCIAADGERLSQREHAQVGIRAELIDLRRGDGDIFGEAAGDLRAHDLQIAAEIGVAGDTGLADAAGADDVRTDAVAVRKTVDTAAGGFDIAAEFVADDERELRGRVLALEAVDIGSRRRRRRPRG